MARTKQIVIGAAVLVVLGAAAFLSSFQGGGKEADQSAVTSAVEPEPGNRAPEFKLPTLDDPNKTVALSDLKGKPVFINFWASWCGPCKQEMPDLQRVYEKNKDKVTFYTINLTGQDDAQKADAFLKQYNITIPALIDPDNKGMKSYKVLSVPSSFVIDANGVVAEKRPGSMPEAEMQGMIDRTLAKQAKS
jgi:cytochrome c biogenesis protein CcmG, thiol:disulfide interchange protein DsbE